MPNSILPPKYQRGPAGEATLRCAKKSVIITMAGKQVELPYEAFPNGIAFDGHFNILMNVKEDKVTSLTPWDGGYIVEFERFRPQFAPNAGLNTPRTELPPAPMREPAREGRKKDGTLYTVREKLVFTAALRVCDGELFEGLHIPLKMEYRFAPSPDGFVGITSGRGMDFQKIEAFLRHTGWLDDGSPVKFSENVLPSMETEIKKLNRRFMVTMDRGFVQSITAAPQLPPARKSSTRTRKPAATKAKSKKK